MALLEGEGLPTLALKSDRLTGMDIHNAFVEASNEEGKLPLIDIMAEWEKIAPHSRELYTRMAEYLNALLIPEAELQASSEKVLDIMAARGLDLHPYRRKSE